MGISLGIKNSRPKKAPTNPILEKAYTSFKKLKHKQVRRDGCHLSRFFFIYLCLPAGAGAGETGGHDRKASTKVAQVKAVPGQALDVSEILRGLVALPLLYP